MRCSSHGCAAMVGTRQHTSTFLFSGSMMAATASTPRVSSHRRARGSKSRIKQARCDFRIKPMNAARHGRACSEIYKPYVLHSTCTFEESPPKLEARIEPLLPKYPAFVAVMDDSDAENDDEVVVGYAYTAPWSPRSAYRYTITPSCYVDTKHHRKGIGFSLMRALIDAARKGGFRTMISVVGDEKNASSIAMHERLGTFLQETLTHMRLCLHR